MDESFYYSIKNPLNDNKVLEAIVNAFSNTDSDSYYHAILNQCGKGRVNDVYSTSDKDSFYVRLFYEWKKRIISFYYDSKIKNSSRRNILTALMKYISNKNPRTYEEVKNIMNPKGRISSDLDEGLFIYSFTNLDDGRYWSIFESKKVIPLGEGLDNDSVKHRLYLNCDSDIIHRVANQFIIRCQEKNIPYLFKFSKGGRDDSFVIYSDDNNLDNYINIINRIIKENNLYKKIHRPPVVTGLVNNYIGYGSNPDSYKVSYHDKRSRVLYNSVCTTTIDTINKCLNLKITDSSNITSSYNNYLVRKLILHVKERLLRSKCEFTREDINSAAFSMAIISSIKNNIKNVMGNNNIEIPFKNSHIKITSRDVYWLLNNQAMFLFKNVDSFRSLLKEEIGRNAAYNDIDPVNFAFDKGIIKTKTYDRVESYGGMRY